MTEEEKEKAIIAQHLADLQHYRRLRIGCPVYGSFYGLLKLRTAQHLADAAPRTRYKYNCGYFDPRTGGFSPYVPA